MHDLLTQIAEFVSGRLQGQDTTMSRLDRSITVAGSAHIAARKALAVAVAEEMREIARCDLMIGKVADLENRAVQAIRGGRDDLARSAAEAIAAIRTDIEASERTSSRFASEVALARREVDAQRRRLADLDRGRRLARIGHGLNGGISGTHPRLDPLAEAETVLEKIAIGNADARAVREEMAPQADRVIERLSNDGFGSAVTVRPADVMARLRMMAAAAALIETELETSRRR